MEAIPLDPVPTGTAIQALPAGNASAASFSKSPFANLLALARDGASRDGADGRGAGDASAAAALLALLFPQPQGLPQAIAAGEDATGIAAAAIGSGAPAPQGLALGRNGLAPGRNDLGTIPGKAQGLASGEPGKAEAQILPSFKQGRGETPPTVTDLAKTVSLGVAAQAQPATSTPLPPELIEDPASAADKLKVSASKANAVLPAPKPEPAAPNASLTDGADTPTPVEAAATVIPPVKSVPSQAFDDAQTDTRRDQDIDAPTTVTAAYADRMHGAGGSTAPHAAVERLANLVEHPELLAAHIQRAVVDGRDRISIALVPQDLGRIDISLDFDHGGKLSAVIAADRPQTLDLLQRDQRGLERALQDAGFKTDSGSLSFNLRGDQRQQQNPMMPWAPPRPAADPWLAASRPLPHPMMLARHVADGRLDIEV
jgi:flagellar hook-length control protein FliK